MERTGGSNLSSQWQSFRLGEFLTRLTHSIHQSSELLFEKALRIPRCNPGEKWLIFEFLRTLFDGNSNMPLEISDSELWYSLEHPKAEVRRAAVRNLASSDIQTAFWSTLASRIRAFQGMAINAHEFRLTDGIAEVLFALERMERDDELTYEQLLALEASLFLGGIGSYDYHREMRLDNDNMSYEDLLALGDRMGTVSTALSEEALVQRLSKSFNENDETKCSICQEEYSSGEEVGKLRCDHKYHLDCIQQWLRIKNWCPVCKVPASSARFVLILPLHVQICS